MSKLKILHINTLDNFGGAAQVAISLLTHTDSENHLAVSKKSTSNPEIIELEHNPLDKAFLFFNKVLWKIGLHKSLKALFSFNNEFNFTYKKLKRLREYKEADIIHLHNLHGEYFDLSALEKIAAEKVIVWTLHDMWAITGGEAYVYDNENYKKGIGFTPFDKEYPLFNPIIDRRQHFLDKKKSIYEKIQKSITFVPVSHWLNECFKKAYVYNPSLQIRCIHNGIDTGTFKNNMLRAWKKPRILFFNIDIPFKGRQLFMNILNSIKHEFDLHVVGQKIKNNYPQTHYDYIKDRNALNDIYNTVDLLVFPSNAENFPLTILEAMSCGVCVIAAETGGIPEMLDSSCGFLFKNNDENSLLDTIEISLTDIQLVREKGKQAGKRVAGNFSIKKTCDDYLKLYHELLGKKAS